MRNFRRNIPALLIAVLLLASCSHIAERDGRPVLAVSIAPQRTLLQAIAGSDYEVVTVLPGGTDPESYDPTPAQRRAVADADAYFITGAFAFEQTMADALPDSVEVVDGNAGIEMIYGTHGEDVYGNIHADPHIWMSARNMRTMAAGMAACLARLRPDHARIYAHRSDSLAAVIDSLDAAIAAILAGAPTHAFAVRHPSLSYFARDYGLRQHAIGMDGKEMSTSGIRRVIDEARADSVAVFFVETDEQAERIASVAQGIGARTVVVNLLDADWQRQLQSVAHAIARP